MQTLLEQALSQKLMEEVNHNIQLQMQLLQLQLRLKGLEEKPEERVMREANGKDREPLSPSS